MGKPHDPWDYSKYNWSSISLKVFHYLYVESFHLIVSLVRSKQENELNNTYVECQIFVHVYTVSF